MLYIEVTKFHFMDMFHDIRPGSFTYEGLSELYDYLTDMGESEPVELDVIGICCQFSQYSSVEAACEAYDLPDREALGEQTLILDCADGSVIIEDF